MTVEEASSKILQTEPTSRESMEEGRSGKDLQRKCLPITSPLIPLYCCIIIIMVLATIVMVLSTFLSDARNWTSSQTFCTSLEAVLGQFETEEELFFLKRYKGPSDHWIGLRRESSHHVWKWTDSTEYNASFVIKGVGECAYLNDIGLSSARSYTDRNWICSKTNNVTMELNTLRTF
ncbi:C-type lectin domain family 2 member D11-like isoform X2 [Delphinapterus leucas]|uniref:C-type lectin domain family 2 member D11-like isoform X2 n=1 Tax=Delphinapterus leucas TaxID=9749 RepID=A0A2Y9NK33_DELLE|nr:C-type lectin domain family 2 member D11-like isoform X2 [Delphinapterus leucas]